MHFELRVHKERIEILEEVPEWYSVHLYWPNESSLLDDKAAPMLEILHKGDDRRDSAQQISPTTVEGRRARSAILQKQARNFQNLLHRLDARRERRLRDYDPNSLPGKTSPTGAASAN
ncbi:hypothetical protein LTS18_001898, partial [Coniosporium uncinatum]